LFQNITTHGALYRSDSFNKLYGHFIIKIMINTLFYNLLLFRVKITVMCEIISTVKHMKLHSAIHNPKRFFVRAYNILLIIVSIGGAGIAGRQIWLQHLPTDQVPECGAGLEYMLEAFPLAEALQMILSGSGECAEVQWQFIGLSIAEWSFICFTVLMISHITVIFTLNNSKL